MTIERQAAAGLKWGGIAKLASQAISWAITLLVLRLLAPADYGLMALSAVVISITAGLAEMGLGDALVQAKTLDRSDLARLTGALWLLNLACGALAALSAPVLANVFEDLRLADVIRVSSLQFLLTAFAAVPQALAYRNMQFKRLAVIDLSTQVIASLVTLALAWSGAGVWALVIGNLAGGAVRTILFLAQGTAVWPSFDFQGIGAYLRFGGAMSGARMVWQLTYQADLLVAGRMFSEALLGVYSVAIHLASLPVQKAMSIVNQVAFPALARLQMEPQRLKTRLLDAIRLLGFVTIPVLWGIAAVAPEFVDVVLGEKWQAAILPLQVVSLVAPLRMLVSVLATAVSAVGRADVELRNTLVGGIVMPMAFLAGAHWGIDGLAISWVAAVPLLFAINFRRTARPLFLTPREIGGALWAPLLAGAIMCGAVAGCRLLLLEQGSVLRLAVLVAVGGVAFLGAMSLMDRAIWTAVKRIALAARS